MRVCFAQRRSPERIVGRYDRGRWDSAADKLHANSITGAYSGDTTGDICIAQVAYCERLLGCFNPEYAERMDFHSRA